MSHYEPSPEEYARALAEVQATWTEGMEEARRSISNPPAEVTTVTRVVSGRRRVKDRSDG